MHPAEAIGTIGFSLIQSSYLRGIRVWDFAPVRFLRIYCNLTPGAVLRWRGGELELEPGVWYIIPPQPHCTGEIRAPFDHFSLHFHLSTGLPQLKCPTALPPNAVADEALARYIGMAERKDSALLRHLLASQILSALLLSLPEEWLRSVGGEDPRIASACRMILADPAQPCSNEVLARAAGMSRSAFIRRFTSEVGESPQEYRRRARIIYACRLLQLGSVTLKEAAERTGFANRYHFSRAFKQLTGVPPAQYVRLRFSAEQCQLINRGYKRQHERYYVYFDPSERPSDD